MPGRPVLRDPQPIDVADILLVESTYGNRLHKSLAETETELVEVIERTLQRKRGNVVMPAHFRAPSAGRIVRSLPPTTRVSGTASLGRSRAKACRWRTASRV